VREPRATESLSATSHRPFDPIGCSRQILVLPNPKYLPPSRGEFHALPPISFDICVELREPPPTIRLGKRVVLRAFVPETTIYKHRDFLRWKHHVGTKTRHVGDFCVETESQPQPMEDPSQLDLDAGISLALPSHTARDDGRRRFHTMGRHVHLIRAWRSALGSQSESQGCDPRNVCRSVSLRFAQVSS